MSFVRLSCARTGEGGKGRNGTLRHELVVSIKNMRAQSIIFLSPPRFVRGPPSFRPRIVFYVLFRNVDEVRETLQDSRTLTL